MTRSETNAILLGFNQTDLPQYSSYEVLRQQLLLAINEGGEGFGSHKFRNNLHNRITQAITGL